MSTPFVPNPDAGAVSTRRLNRQRVLDVVRRLGPLSRADLAKRTQLSPPTVSALVEELTSGVGLLREIGIGVSSGGRPPILLEFNADYGTIAGVDVGPRDVRVALADLQGRVLARHQEPSEPGTGPGVDRVHAAIATILARTGRDPRRCFAIAVGAPGLADVTGRVNAPGVPGWADLPLGDLLTARFGVPVLVDGHANLAAIGERWQGVAQGVADFVFLALGERVGAGIVIAGRLHRGHQWQAGDISGLMLAVPAAPAAEGMPSMLQRLVASVITLLDPALVVCGGSLLSAHPEFVDRLRTALSTITRRVPAIERSALGEEATLLGAIHAARELSDAHVFAVAGGGAIGPRRIGVMPIDLIVFGPHPDDAEIGLGGTIARHTAGGSSVGICDLSAGELGSNGSPEIRRREADAAARVLGVAWRENLGWPDGAMTATPALLQSAVELMRRHHPRTIAVPYWVDRHPDHVAASHTLTEAAFKSGLRRYEAGGAPWRPEWVCYYFINDGAAPSFVVDVSAQYERKREALACYESQFAAAGGDAVATRLTASTFRQLIESRDTQFGALAGVGFAEGLVVREPLVRSSLLRSEP